MSEEIKEITEEVKKPKMITFNAVEYDQILVPLLDIVLRAGGIKGLGFVDAVREKAAIFHKDG